MKRGRKEVRNGKGVRINGCPLKCALPCHHQATTVVKLRFGTTVQPTFVCNWHKHWFALKLSGYTKAWRG